MSRYMFLRYSLVCYIISRYIISCCRIYVADLSSHNFTLKKFTLHNSTLHNFTLQNVSCISPTIHNYTLHIADAAKTCAGTNFTLAREPACWQHTTTNKHTSPYSTLPPHVSCSRGVHGAASPQQAYSTQIARLWSPRASCWLKLRGCRDPNT